MQTQMLVDEAVETLQTQINDTAIIACSVGGTEIHSGLVEK